MNDLILVGNCANIIDWSAVVNTISKLPPKEFTMPTTPKSAELLKMLTDAGYSVDDRSIHWVNYYPEIDYDPTINTMFGEFVGHTRYARAWISKVNPGNSVPWHWDADDNEDEYLLQGDLVRYSCRINPASAGQVTVVGDHCLYADPIGDVYKWADYNLWHGSVNCGFEPKYQFNYLAYKND